MSWSKGYLLSQCPLDARTRSLVLAQDWLSLDRMLQGMTAPGGVLFEELKRHADFTAIEHMLALRDGASPDEEDGIWHDDGSRVLAFSLSLNFFGLPQGGELEIRPKGEGLTALGPYPPGTLVIFRTGRDGFEHRTRKVTAGLRLVCAGWCSGSSSPE